MAYALMVVFGAIAFFMGVGGHWTLTISFSAASVCAAILHGASVIADGLRATVEAQAQLHEEERAREISKELHEYRESRPESK